MKSNSGELGAPEGRRDDRLGVSDDGTLVHYVVHEEESDIWMLEAAHEHL